MLRLMGKQPIDALGRPEVTCVFLACHVLEPQFDYAFQELRSEMYVGQHTFQGGCWNGGRKLGSLPPPNGMAARVELLGISSMRPSASLQVQPRPSFRGRRTKIGFSSELAPGEATRTKRRASRSRNAMSGAATEELIFRES